MGSYLISLRSNGQFQFNLKTINGQTILTSEVYSSKSDCQQGIDSAKTNSQNELNYELKVSSQFKFYFTLKAENGQIIGTSEMYDSFAARSNGIQSVKLNANDANVVDHK